MANLTSHFVVDFTAFYDAMRKATAHLEGFQKEADDVSATLDKMTNAFSGKNVMQQAGAMAVAIEKLGGVGTLTDKELRKAGAAVDEAMAKMKKLGIEVPQSFKDISEAAKGVQQPTENWGSALSTLTTIVKGFIGLQIVQWFKNAAAAGIEWASSMAKMKAQTDLSYRDLQILENASIATGSSLEGLAKSVQVLQQRVGSGEARKGIEDLGLSFEELRAMRPADQFAEIASALGRIEDPTRRAAAAAAIFGGSWREAMPALRANLEEVAATTKVVADAHIDALDRMSARFNTILNDSKKFWVDWGGELALGLEKGVASFQEANRRAAAIRAHGAAGAIGVRQEGPTMGGAAAAPKLPDLGVVSEKDLKGMRELGETWEEHAERVAAAARAQREYAESIKNTTEPMNDWVGLMYSGTLQMRRAFIEINPLIGGIEDLQRLFAAQQDIPVGNLQTRLDAQAKVIDKMPSTFKRMGGNLEAFLTDDLGRIMASAIQGGGNVAKSALMGLGQSMFAKGSGLSDAIGGGITNLFGKDGMMGKIGSQLSTLVPVIGSFIGPAIEGITALGKKLFGKSEETAKVSPLRDEFFKLQGGLETLNPKVLALGGNLSQVQAVMNAKTVAEYQTAIAALNDLFKAEDDALKVLTDTAAKYGLTLEELGPAMQRQELDKQAQQLYKDWQVLNAAGIETTVIAGRMSETVNKYTQDAVKMGVEVPEAMRPMLEQMIEMGQLTDASGKKVNSLEESGISFALSMSEGFKALIGEVQKLTDVLTRSLGGAVQDTTDKIGRIPRKVSVEIETVRTERGGGGGGEVPGFQGGTGGKFLDFGAGTLAMLHGREAIVPESAVATAGIGGGLAAPITIVVNAQGSFFDTPGDVQRLAEKVNAALTAKHGMTNRSRAA